MPSGVMLSSGGTWQVKTVQVFILEAPQPPARGVIPAGLRGPYWILQSATFWEDQEGVALINHSFLGS